MNSPVRTGQSYAYGTRGQTYSDERQKRWSLEKQHLSAIAHSLKEKLSSLLNTAPDSAKVAKYADSLFAKYGPDVPWVHGAPDLRFDFPNTQYLFCEIKIKQEVFRKTQRGGTTKTGLPIPNYGCPSFYLDKDPVLQNMHAWQQKGKIDPEQFVICFSETDPNGIDTAVLFTLKTIETLEIRGWKGKPIMTNYSQGYGAPCLLLPKDAGIPVHRLTKTSLSSMLSERDLTPQTFEDKLTFL